MILSRASNVSRAFYGLIAACKSAAQTSTGFVKLENYFFRCFTAISANNNILQPENRLPVIVPVRTFKDKDVLRLRCKDCYFKKMDGRWYVLCNTRPRHKQRQKIIDIRHKWIVTHVTYGRKKF